MIEENIRIINEKIEIAAGKSGRKPSEITLIAVTKTVEPAIIQSAVNLGAANLGENKAQELLAKIPVIEGDVNWHFIGNLQTNKAKDVVGKVVLIHSVSSVKLAAEIDKRAEKLGVVQNVLLQINIGLEDSKGGFMPEEADYAVSEISSYKNIRIKGFMCIPPNTSDKILQRDFFRQMKTLFDLHKNSENTQMEYLSMGMSSDFEIAIEEGSNIVRVGTSIFGHRNYVN